MKNKYVMPEMDVVEINYATSLMAGSPNLGSEYTGNQVLGRELDFDDEYDEDEE